MKRFQDYKVFQDSHALNMQIYDLTKSLPRDELFGLTSQMRRAASSIPMNIAEGSVKSEREFRQALRISLGSAAEVEYQILMARDLGYLDQHAHEDLTAKITAIRKMLTAFIRAIDRSVDNAKDQRLTTNNQPEAIP